MRDHAEQVGTEQKIIKVDSINERVQMDEAQAAYLRQASSQALLGGELGAAGSVVQGVGGALPGIAKLF